MVKRAAAHIQVDEQAELETASASPGATKAIAEQLLQRIWELSHVKKRVTVSQLRYTQKAIDDSKLVEGKVKFKDDCTAKANYKWINPTYPMSITGVITHLRFVGSSPPSI